MTTDYSPVVCPTSGGGVPVGEIPNLRETGSSRTRVQLAFRKRTPTAGTLGSILLDGDDMIGL